MEDVAAGIIGLCGDAAAGFHGGQNTVGQHQGTHRCAYAGGANGNTAGCQSVESLEVCANVYGVKGCNLAACPDSGFNGVGGHGNGNGAADGVAGSGSPYRHPNDDGGIFAGTVDGHVAAQGLYSCAAQLHNGLVVQHVDQNLSANCRSTGCHRHAESHFCQKAVGRSKDVHVLPRREPCPGGD